MKHHKLFSFQVAPNSWLNVSHAQQKMFSLQLLREGLLDPWTVWEDFDIVDTGPSPADTVPARIVKARELGLLQGPTPELVMAQLQQQLLEIQAQVAQLQGGPPIQGGPPPREGRPPSGQIPPQAETRDNGTRPIVAESR
jgi:hypothetical protein